MATHDVIVASNPTCVRISVETSRDSEAVEIVIHRNDNPADNVFVILSGGEAYALADVIQEAASDVRL